MSPSDTVLIVPGLHGSGPEHWQSWFETELAGTVRVNQDDWGTPDLSVWSAALERAIRAAHGPVWVVAHSFGCLVTAALIPQHRERIAGAMLVAPADPDKFGISEQLPASPFNIPSVIVASTNDPWMRLMRAAWLADRWGSRIINLGAAGHVNPDSGFGPWPNGLTLFEGLRSAADGLPNGAIDDAADTRQFPMAHDAID